MYIDQLFALHTQTYELISDSTPNHSWMLTSNSIYMALAVHDGKRTGIAVTEQHWKSDKRTYARVEATHIAITE